MVGLLQDSTAPYYKIFILATVRTWNLTIIQHLCEYSVCAKPATVCETRPLFPVNTERSNKAITCFKNPIITSCVFHNSSRKVSRKCKKITNSINHNTWKCPEFLFKIWRHLYTYSSFPNEARFSSNRNHFQPVLAFKLKAITFNLLFRFVAF
jgi:hypothetical protein